MKQIIPGLCLLSAFLILLFSLVTADAEILFQGVIALYLAQTLLI